jgi:hypothetical protein
MDNLWLLATFLSGENPFPVLYVIREKNRQRREQESQLRLACMESKRASDAGNVADSLKSKTESEPCSDLN